MRGVGVSLVLVGSWAVVGCDDAAVQPTDDVVARFEAGNGMALNSAALNGLQLNGLQLNGLQLNGLQLNGLQLNGLQLNGLQLNGSAFSGTLPTADGPVTKSGADFVGAEIQLTVAGEPYTMRIDAVYKDPARPTGDVYFHEISVRKESEGTWTSLCKDGTGQPVAAIPIVNYWNTTTGARVDDANVITFACRGAALAKCIEWGYVPWHTAVHCTTGCATVSLQDHHQACTRMVRADYCGDGRSYTFDGTPIDLYDRLQTRLQTRSTLSNPEWSPEAEWGPNGATCIGDELRLQMYDDLGVAYTPPTCLDNIDDFNDCGSLAVTRPASRVANAYCYKWTDDPALCNVASHNDD